MKICYIISTCDKYLDTRVKYQMNTYLKNVDKEDIYYLTSKPNHENRQFGWYSMDDPQNITWKYIHFIYNMNIPDYDWYMFIDDDTFVFMNRLETFLKDYNHSELFYIGNELDHIKDNFCLYMSGGAGYAISNGLYKLLYNYVKTTGINNSYKHWCDDLCIGLWINELKQTNDIKQIDNKRFFICNHKNDQELNNGITFHGTMTEEANNFYNNILTNELENNKNNGRATIDMTNTNETVFVLVTDLSYFNKAKRTIIDLRTKGKWSGPIVLITIDFHLNENFKQFYNVLEVQFDKIDKTNLLSKIGENGFSNSDKRETTKLNQWEKLHVFDNYFTKWQRVVFLDAGLRVLDDVKYLLELDYKCKILAPIDGKHDKHNDFNCQLSYDNLELIEKVKIDFGEDILKETYFLNCIWIYDTEILKLCNKNQLIEAMNEYTLCRTNEMGIMNLLFTFKYHLWEPFPFKTVNGKFLFDWCELNNPNTNWTNYCYIKYPVTITFEDC